MERKSPYVLVGAAMIVFIAAVAGFVIWKLRAGDRTSYAYYVILFSGDVQGLTNDSPVFYRGLRVGRVHSIQLTSRVDTQRSTGRERLTEKIEVTVAVDWNIDIRERSYAVFEKPFIAGAPFIQIVGRLDVDQVKPKKRLGQTPYPEIREGASFLQATSTSAQELLTKAGVTVDRLNELLSPDNVGAVSDTLRNLSTTTTGLAKQDAAIQATLAELPGAVAEFRKTFDKLNGVAESLNMIALEVGPQDEATRKALAGKDPGELRKALAEARKAFANIDGAANQLGKLVTDNKAPIRALHRDRPHRAVAHHSRAAPAHRQPERHRHPARARPGRLRVQRQAGIYAQMIVRMAVCAAAAASLAACQLLNAVTEPIDLYTVTPKSTFDPDLPAVYWQLAVEAPAAAANLSTGRIAIALTPTSSDYYANAAWTDRAPLMVQTRIVDSFENTRKIVAVSRESIELRANYVLQPDLRNFEALYYYGMPPIVRVRIIAKLVRLPDRQIIGVASFERCVRARADKIPKVVEAFDQALGSVIKRLVSWTLRTPPPRPPSEAAPAISGAIAIPPMP